MAATQIRLNMEFTIDLSRKGSRNGGKYTFENTREKEGRHGNGKKIKQVRGYSCAPVKEKILLSWRPSPGELRCRGGV